MFWIVGSLWIIKFPLQRASGRRLRPCRSWGRGTSATTRSRRRCVRFAATRPTGSTTAFTPAKREYICMKLNLSSCFVRQMISKHYKFLQKWKSFELMQKLLTNILAILLTFLMGAFAFVAFLMLLHLRFNDRFGQGFGNCLDWNRTPICNAALSSIRGKADGEWETVTSRTTRRRRAMLI